MKILAHTLTHQRRFWVLLALAGFIGATAGAGVLWRRWQNSGRPKPLPQDPQIQVYFNQNQAQGADYREAERGIRRRGDNLEDLILKTLDSAATSIDLAVQELRLPRIARKLVEKHQQGVKVRVVLEHQYNSPIQTAPAGGEKEGESDRSQDLVAFIDQNGDGQIGAEESRARDAVQILRDGQVPLIDDREDGSKGTGLMHHKFIVVDGQTLIVTSANFTPSDQHGDFLKPETRGNANNFLLINSPQLAQIFTQEFNFLWGDGPAGAKNSLFGINKLQRAPQTIAVGQGWATVKFSPDSRKVPWGETSNGLIARYLNAAEKSVNLALFVFSEQRLADTLQAPFRRGAGVKALIDPGFAYRYYSEGLDLLGVTLLEKCRPEAENQPWPYPSQFVGIPALAEGDKLHHKFALIDNQTVITGSHNWSPSANLQNDETVLIIQNPTVGAHYQREFERLAAEAEWGVPSWVRRKIEDQQKTCALPSSAPLKAASPTVNLNSAGQKELESLPGIGPRLAQRLMEARQQRPFTGLEDLERVPGFKKGKIEALRGRVTW
ncbi:MAG: phospholipase D-like domain-containing protein [Cyanobacteriota bacterium]|jgi:phosphatidylserine/phosphatidylglycerophosphate/cardiolipin synthase-like enzyme